MVKKYMQKTTYKNNYITKNSIVWFSAAVLICVIIAGAYIHNSYTNSKSSKVDINDSEKMFLAQEKGDEATYNKNKNEEALSFLDGNSGYNGNNDSTYVNLINKIDRDSFEEIGDFYHKDKEFVIYSKYEGGSSFLVEIIGADSDSFEIIKNPYSRDKNFIYFQEKKTDIETHNEIKFEMENNSSLYYAKDDDSVYFQGTKMVDVDFASFEIISCSYLFGCYSRDKNNVYCYDIKLEKADVETFTSTNYPEYMRDTDNIWDYCDLMGLDDVEELNLKL
jgi:hypothetical protein